MKAKIVIFAPCFKTLVKIKVYLIVSERSEYEHNKL